MLIMIVPQVGAELKSAADSQIVPQVEGQLQDAILPQVGAKIKTLLSAVPWGHHKYIMDKCGEDTKIEENEDPEIDN